MIALSAATYWDLSSNLKILKRNRVLVLSVKVAVLFRLVVQMIKSPSFILTFISLCQINMEQTLYRNYQKVTLQESPGRIPG